MSRNFTSLSSGVLDRINRGEKVRCPVVLQILGDKRIPSYYPTIPERIQLVLNDGVSTNETVNLTYSLNQWYEEGKLEKFTIIQLMSYAMVKGDLKDKKDRPLTIFVFDILHAGEEVGCKIEISKGGAPSNSTVQQAQKENFSGNTNSYAEPSSNRFNSSNATMMNTSSSAGDLSEHPTIPIESLSQNKWVIKARIMSKSAIRTWSNAKGKGKLFSMDLCDETGEIRCTAFGDMVDRYYDMLEVDEIYYISKCQLKPANKQYSQLKNDYEMTMTSETKIQPCIEENSAIPKIKYSLVSSKDSSEESIPSASSTPLKYDEKIMSKYSLYKTRPTQEEQIILRILITQSHIIKAIKSKMMECVDYNEELWKRNRSLYMYNYIKSRLEERDWEFINLLTSCPDEVKKELSEPLKVFDIDLIAIEENRDMRTNKLMPNIPKVNIKVEK